MTIRGGGDPASRHGFQTALKNGPAAPELRRDAHDCIMVAILTDQPNTRLRGTPCVRCELPSELSSLVRAAGLPDHHSLPPCSGLSRLGLQTMEREISTERRPALTAPCARRLPIHVGRGEETEFQVGQRN